MIRARLVLQRNQLLVPLKEAKGYVSKDLQKMEQRLVKDGVKGIEKSLEKTEKEIDTPITNDANMSHQFHLLTSIECVGRITAIYMLIATNKFKDFSCPKKFAYYSGVHHSNINQESVYAEKQECHTMQIKQSSNCYTLRQYHQ